MTDKLAESQQFCVSTIDGRIEPALDVEESKQLSKFFAPDLTIGERYRLISCIGQGGMGQVFLARDERLDRQVAIKVVSRSRINDEQNFYETMLAREAKLGANLNHPGIATVHDFGFHGGRSYTVFEFVDGSNLRTLLEENGHFELEQAQDVIAGLARALDFAHGQGIVHRDLKPENICRSKTGEYKILDFGIARDFVNDSDRPSFAGTPAYSAPEQVASLPVDGKTDQYTLACVFFELLTCRKVFEGETFQEFLDKHLSDEPPKISTLIRGVPSEVDAAVSRALSKDPKSRFDSCQEFAEALGCDQAKVFFRKLAEISDREKTNCYLCHASEDSIFARQLANRLDEFGYSSWYYQRDAIPGLSLFAQTDEAIRHSSICIILISRTAIESTDLAREIQQAHRVGTALVPVLLDLSLQEFEALHPVWRTILGPIAKIEADRNGVDTLASRLRAAAQTLGIHPSNAPTRKTPSYQPITGQIWATDGYQIDISELRQIVFENEIITHFLTRRNKHFISATKGLGKTLLLTYKRLLLTEEFKKSGSSITLVPQGRPFLDFMGELRSLSQKYEAPLSELTNAKRLWSAALRISAISYCEGLIADDEKFELKPFSERIRRWLIGNHTEPTIVFKELTSLSVSDFNRLIDITEGFLDQKLRQVHSPIYFFIDKVDQAIRNLGSAAWINVQAGLIEAAWDVMNSNNHIKIFASIRDEAFSNYESDIKSNLRGAVTSLRYSESELAELLDRLSQCYEGADSFKDFVGMNVVTSGRQTFFLEDSFQLIRRYTFGRPRDLVSIASEMSAAKSSLNENRFSTIIRETAATGLIPSIFDETRIFLDSLREKKARLRFLSSLPCNILERHQIDLLTAKFNGLPPDAIEHLENFTDLYQPFRELFLAGVLGVIVDDPNGNAPRQHFKQPDDLVNSLERHLPESPFYLIHPALDVFIQKNRPKADYQVFQQIPIGFLLPWRHYYELICQIERSLQEVDDPKMADAVHQVLQKYQLAARNKSEEALESVFTSAEWKWINQNATGRDRENVLLWLNELVQLS